MHISCNRVIVEKIFGRMTSLWGMTYIKYLWDHKNYDMMFRLAVGLTNFHITINPLRAKDGDDYRIKLNRLYELEKKAQEMRLKKQQKYRDRRHQRLEYLSSAAISGIGSGGSNDDYSDVTELDIAVEGLDDEYDIRADA